MKGFLSDIYLRPACFQCQFKNGKSNSDLTIGDLWGADKITPNFYDTLGVGIVIPRSKKGGGNVLHPTIRKNSGFRN